MEEQAKIPVSLPRPNPTVSYWQDPPSAIADLRTTPDLPSEADYVVIGSGISGACIAFNILEREPGAKVVMLEARQTCSGATGRNGGHTKPASYRAFPSNEEAYGVEEARRISKLEFSNRTNTIAFAEKHNIECDLNPCHTVDIIYDQGEWEAGVKAIKRMQKMLPTGAEQYEIFDAAEAKTRYLTADALGAFESDAGSIQPYKFVTGVLKLALSKGLNLQTTTPATSLARAEADGGSDKPKWQITSARGTITTQTCILATNGYTAHLLPELQGLIVPLRGQMSVQRPGSNLPNGGCLRTTYSFVYAHGYEYMITRPPGSTHAGDMCIGGGLALLPNQGAGEFGNTDDTVLNAQNAKYLRDCTAHYFGDNWGEDHPDGRVRREWTGIMGFTPDGLPYVGPVPGVGPGLWVCAGFNGHGMSTAFNSVRGLIGMLYGEEEQLKEWFPEAYRLNEERIARNGVFHGRRESAHAEAARQLNGEA